MSNAAKRFLFYCVDCDKGFTTHQDLFDHVGTQEHLTLVHKNLPLAAIAWENCFDEDPEEPQKA